MKNSLITIALSLLITSCAQSKYGSLDQQFAAEKNHNITAKYNNKNCIETQERKKELVRQIAIVTKQ